MTEIARLRAKAARTTRGARADHLVVELVGPGVVRVRSYDGGVVLEVPASTWAEIGRRAEAVAREAGGVVVVGLEVAAVEGGGG